MPDIHLRQWSPQDLPLLRRANAEEMTEHLGGSESDAEVGDRHERYLRFWRDGGARKFAITRDGVGVGGVGWWSTRWRDRDVYEAGWFVVPEAQGHGVAASALRLMIADARAHGDGRLLTAFPSANNVASNGLCGKVGFTLAGTEEFPFRGVVLHVNAWMLNLASAAG